MSAEAYTVLPMPVLRPRSPLTVATYPTLFGAPVAVLLASPCLIALDWESAEPERWPGGFLTGVASGVIFSAIAPGRASY